MKKYINHVLVSFPSVMIEVVHLLICLLAIFSFFCRCPLCILLLAHESFFLYWILRTLFSYWIVRTFRWQMKEISCLSFVLQIFFHRILFSLWLWVCTHTHTHNTSSFSLVLWFCLPIFHSCGICFGIKSEEEILFNFFLPKSLAGCPIAFIE